MRTYVVYVAFKPEILILEPTASVVYLRVNWKKVGLSSVFTADAEDVLVKLAKLFAAAY